MQKYHPLLIGGVATVALYIVGDLMRWLAPLALLVGAGWCLWKVTQSQKPDGPLWKFYEEHVEPVWKKHVTIKKK